MKNYYPLLSSVPSPLVMLPISKCFPLSSLVLGTYLESQHSGALGRRIDDSKFQTSLGYIQNKNLYKNGVGGGGGGDEGGG